jgi:hypothetical protein
MNFTKKSNYCTKKSTSRKESHIDHTYKNNIYEVNPDIVYINSNWQTFALLFSEKKSFLVGYLSLFYLILIFYMELKSA